MIYAADLRVFILFFFILLCVSFFAHSTKVPLGWPIELTVHETLFKVNKLKKDTEERTRSRQLEKKTLSLNLSRVYVCVMPQWFTTRYTKRGVTDDEIISFFCFFFFDKYSWERSANWMWFEWEQRDRFGVLRCVFVFEFYDYDAHSAVYVQCACM